MSKELVFKQINKMEFINCHETIRIFKKYDRFNTILKGLYQNKKQQEIALDLNISTTRVGQHIAQLKRIVNWRYSKYISPTNEHLFVNDDSSLETRLKVVRSIETLISFVHDYTMKMLFRYSILMLSITKEMGFHTSETYIGSARYQKDINRITIKLIRTCECIIYN